MLVNELFQLRNQTRGATQREVRLDPILDRFDPKLVECGDWSLCERLVREVGQGGSTPQGEGSRNLGRPQLRRSAAGLIDQPLESVGVNGIGLDRQPIPASERLEKRARQCLGPIRIEHMPQPRNQTMNNRSSGGRRSLPPQLVDE
jgi:hypothetical protein